MQNKKVLIVDDVPVNVQLLSIMLKGLGGSLEGAFSAEDVMEREDGKDFDIALLDIHLDGQKDGFDLASHLRALNPEMILIGITGDTLDEAVEKKALSHGFDQIVQKPVKKDFLLELFSSDH